jgi:hypothetical protein
VSCENQGVAVLGESRWKNQMGKKSSGLLFLLPEKAQKIVV